MQIWVIVESVVEKVRTKPRNRILEMPACSEVIVSDSVLSLDAAALAYAELRPCFRDTRILPARHIFAKVIQRAEIIAAQLRLCWCRPDRSSRR